MELLFIWILLGVSTCIQSVKYGVFLENGITSASEASSECAQRGGSLPLPTNTGENDALTMFMEEVNITSVWLDIQRTVFPWVERRAERVESYVIYQGCFSENPSFQEVHITGRRSFDLGDCRKRCTDRGLRFSAVKGKENGGLFREDKMSCMCSKTLSGSAQASRTRCPEKCNNNAEWCRVDRVNQPNLLVYLSDSVGSDVSWDNDDMSSLTNTDGCGLYLPETGAVRKSNCRSRETVFCLNKNGSYSSPQARLTWIYAQQICENLGARLPTLIESKNLPRTSPFWSAITAFNWTTRSDDPIVYSNWAPNFQPVNANKVCAVHTNTGNWLESPCNLKLPLVCQIDDDGSFGTPGLPDGEGLITTSSLPNVTSSAAARNQGAVSQSRSLSPGAIAGVVIGAIIGLIIVICVILLFIVAFSRREKEELPKPTRNSKIYRVSTEETPDYMSMSRIVSTVSSQTAGHNSLVPNGRTASTEFGSNDAGQASGNFYDIQRAESHYSHVSLVDNDAYRSSMASSSADRSAADVAEVYEEPCMNRRPTLGPAADMDGYVPAEVGGEDQHTAPDYPGTAQAKKRDCPATVPGAVNASYLPDKMKTTQYLYDTPEPVDVRATTPPASPMYGNISSPENIYMNA